jgi:RNA polymerase sigma-70 factor (ECF subfamily)
MGSSNLAERPPRTVDPTATAPLAVVPGALDLKRAFFEHAGRVESFLRRLGIPPADAADLCSEVFLVAHQRRGSFDPLRPVLPWLLGIAVHLAQRHRRRLWVRRLVGRALERDGESVEPSAIPEQALLAAEDRRRVRRTLAELPDKKRVLLVLREFEELSAEEIGQALGMPEASVYSALHYARKEFLRKYRQRLCLEASR